MLGRSVVFSRSSLFLAKSLPSARSTWVLRRVYAPDSTLSGERQRSPEELPSLMKLEIVDYETLKPGGPLKLILLQDIEGVGHQFDVVDVDRKLARTDLLPTRKAVYASRFDLEYYAKVKEKMADELAKRVRIPYEYICIGRDLQALVVPIKVSMENKWTIDKNIIKTSLRQTGVDMVDDAIFLDGESISGPNFEIEARLIRFYAVVAKRYIVPMLGRITHISVTESKQAAEAANKLLKQIDQFNVQMLTPESNCVPTAEQLQRFGLEEEQPYYSETPDIIESFPVVDFMKKRAR